MPKVDPLCTRRVRRVQQKLGLVSLGAHHLEPRERCLLNLPGPELRRPRRGLKDDRHFDFLDIGLVVREGAPLQVRFFLKEMRTLAAAQ